MAIQTFDIFHKRLVVELGKVKFDFCCFLILLVNLVKISNHLFFYCKYYLFYDLCHSKWRK